MAELAPGSGPVSASKAGHDDRILFSLRRLLAGLSSSQPVGQKVSGPDWLPVKQPPSALCHRGLSAGEQLTNANLLCESKWEVPERVSEQPSVYPSQSFTA